MTIKTEVCERWEHEGLLTIKTTPTLPDVIWKVISFEEVLSNETYFTNACISLTTFIVQQISYLTVFDRGGDMKVF